MRTITLPERFWAKVEITDDCWTWIAGRRRNGYGVFNLDGRQYVAHRLAYEDVNGPVPEGLELDHLCRNRACVRPSHLEPVTRRENLLRSPITLTSLKAAQTHCIGGHEFTSENTIIRKQDGTRHCRECARRDQRKMKRHLDPKRREYMRQYYLRRKAARPGR